MLKRMPMSTRANSFLPKFGFGASNNIEDSAYQPSAAEGGKANGMLNFHRQQSSGLKRRGPVSTRASDTIGKVYFPGEVSNDEVSEGINDISGIVQDMSNIEDTSFAITINDLNKNGGSSSG